MESAKPLPTFAQLLARLHLHAVLPALEDLATLSANAREIAQAWKFSIRLKLGGPFGAAATLRSPGNGTLQVDTLNEAGGSPDLTLRFLSAAQLNATFLNKKTFPPVPTGGFWRIAGVGSFTALAKQLDAALQPDPARLADDPEFRLMHLRLLFRVLLGAIPVLAAGDSASRNALAHTPDGLAEIRAPALDVSGWVRWGDGQMTSGPGPARDNAPDVVITFVDRATAEAALLGGLDPNAAVGLGLVDVRGLVPLADGLSVLMDRVEAYLKPAK